jgi:hypothetical protein
MRATYVNSEAVKFNDVLLLIGELTESRPTFPSIHAGLRVDVGYASPF